MTFGYLVFVYETTEELKTLKLAFETVRYDFLDHPIIEPYWPCSFSNSNSITVGPLNSSYFKRLAIKASYHF